jgi:hypothetical protein
LTAQYLERHAPRKRSCRDDQRMLTTHLAVFRTRKLTDLTRNEVALLRKMFNLARDRGSMLGRILSLASKCFTRPRVIGLCNRRNFRDSFRRSRRKRIPRFAHLKSVGHGANYVSSQRGHGRSRSHQQTRGPRARTVLR